MTLIPGSVEQRGAVFRTASGDPPYCRSAPGQANFLSPSFLPYKQISETDMVTNSSMPHRG